MDARMVFSLLILKKLTSMFCPFADGVCSLHSLFNVSSISLVPSAFSMIYPILRSIYIVLYKIIIGFECLTYSGYIFIDKNG
jgi:hypothetical protein